MAESSLIQPNNNSLTELGTAPTNDTVGETTPESDNTTLESIMVPSSSSMPNLVWHLKQGAPLLLLVIFNLIYTQTISIVLFVGLLVVFDWSNNIVVQQITMQNKRSPRKLLFLMMFLLFNAVMTIPVVDTFWLCNLFSFSTWITSSTSFWRVLFDVAIMDFVFKYFTLALKCILVILPKRIMQPQNCVTVGLLVSINVVLTLVEICMVPVRYFTTFEDVTAMLQLQSLFRLVYRAGLLFFCEALSQTVRCLLPIPQWIRFVLKSSSCMAILVCGLVVMLYCLVKLHSLQSKVEVVAQSWKSWKQPRVIGQPLVGESEDKSCPICHHPYEDPVTLPCHHVFCFHCCQMWFDWEKHCPVCSSNGLYSVVMEERLTMPALLQLASRSPKWKRGTTDYLVHLF